MAKFTDDQIDTDGVTLRNGVKLVRRVTMVNVDEDDGGLRRTILSLRKILQRMPPDEVKRRIDKVLAELM